MTSHVLFTSHYPKLLAQILCVHAFLVRLTKERRLYGGLISKLSSQLDATTELLRRINGLRIGVRVSSIDSEIRNIGKSWRVLHRKFKAAADRSD